MEKNDNENKDNNNIVNQNDKAIIKNEDKDQDEAINDDSNIIKNNNDMPLNENKDKNKALKISNNELIISVNENENRHKDMLNQTYNIQYNIQDDNDLEDFWNKFDESIINFGKQFITIKVYVIGIISGLIIIILGYLYSFLISDSSNSNQEGLEKKMESSPASSIFYICLFAPVFEEFIFRKIIFGFIKKYSLIMAYIISCFLFSFCHFGLSFSVLIKEWETFPVYFILGAILAFTYNYEGCLLSSIISHSFNNIFETALFYIES